MPCHKTSTLHVQTAWHRWEETKADASFDLYVCVALLPVASLTGGTDRCNDIYLFVYFWPLGSTQPGVLVDAVGAARC